MFLMEELRLGDVRRDHRGSYHSSGSPEVAWPGQSPSGFSSSVALATIIGDVLSLPAEWFNAMITSAANPKYSRTPGHSA